MSSENHNPNCLTGGSNKWKYTKTSWTECLAHKSKLYRIKRGRKQDYAGKHLVFFLKDFFKRQKFHVHMWYLGTCTCAYLCKCAHMSIYAVYSFWNKHNQEERLKTGSLSLTQSWVPSREATAGAQAAPVRALALWCCPGPALHAAMAPACAFPGGLGVPQAPWPGTSGALPLPTVSLWGWFQSLWHGCYSNSGLPLRGLGAGEPSDRFTPRSCM